MSSANKGGKKPAAAGTSTGAKGGATSLPPVAGASKVSNNTPQKKTDNAPAATTSVAAANKSKTPSKTPTKLPALSPRAEAAKNSESSNVTAAAPVEPIVSGPPVVDGTANTPTPTNGDNTTQDQGQPGLQPASVATAPPTEPLVTTSTPVVEEAPAPPINGNGTVKLMYEQYDELFPIVNGSTTQENIDEVYCLTFVMPNCKILLSKYSPKEKREKEDLPFSELFIAENPPGTYQGLEADKVYYVYVEQDAERLKRDQEEMRRIAQTMEGAAKANDPLKKDDGRVLESCSCIYGNPCVDEYGCKDWSNRFAIATKNGWKGF